MEYTIPKNTGFDQNPFDPRDAWVDEVLGDKEIKLPKSYRTDGLRFDPQGSYPFCVSFTTTTMVEHLVQKETGVTVALSQPHLFYHSGGGEKGSFFRANLDTALNRGLVPYGTFPMPNDIWNKDFYGLKEKALKVPFTDARKIGGYLRTSVDRESLKKSIYQTGCVLVGVSASPGYWVDKAFRPKARFEDNHAVLLAGWDEEDNWWAFDSLQPFKDFDGYHRFDKTYYFNSGYVVTSIPEDWKQKRDEKRKQWEHCLNHYGQPRNFELEQSVAAELLVAFRKFNNVSVLEAAGRFWTQLVNAAAYGGYSISYYKWGTYQPGDLVNLIYAWRRTGQFLFDLDRERSTYK